MAWDVDSGWVAFAQFFSVLPWAVLAVAVLALATRAQATARRLGLVAALAAATFLLLMAHLDGGVASWERDLLARLHLSLLAGLAPVSGLASFPILLAASLALAAWPMARGRWHEAIVALVAGPGLGGLAVAGKLAYPRAPPVPHPIFGDAMATPDTCAALLAGLAILGCWLVWRLKPDSSRIGWLLALPAALLLSLIPVVGGWAWPGDIVAGWLLALLWVPACLAAGWLAFGLMSGQGALGRLGELLGRLADRVAARATAWLLALVAVGVALRIASYWWTPLGVDAFAYAAMAKGLLDTGSFTMPWGDVHTYLDAPAPSHHYPPLYPAILAGFVKVLGFSAATTHVAGIATSLAALLAMWLCSRDLYGPRKALVATAALAVSPIFVQNTGQAYSENLVLLIFVLTLWAILKSLEKPWFIVLAGILAGLGYLTKSSMGYFFILAGLGGLAWRLRWRGWKVLRDPAYVAAIVLFGAIVASWAARNVLLFGSWETSAHLSAAYGAAFADPLRWLMLSLVAFVFYATAGYLLYLALLPVLPSLARAPKLASEHDSGLWLALGLPLLLTALIDGALWLIEGEFFLNNARYIGFVAVPALWLLVRHARAERRSVRVGAVLAFAILLAGSLFFAKPTVSNVELSADVLRERMAPGDTLGFVDMNNHLAYRYYFGATADGTREVQVQITCAVDPLCPPGRPGPETLNATWVYMRGDGGGRLPADYVEVTDAYARFVPGKAGFISLWHRSA